MATSESYIPSLLADALGSSRKRDRFISRELYRSAVVISEALADFVTCAGAIIAAYFLQLHIGRHIQIPMQRVTAVSLVYGLFAVFSLNRRGAYGSGNSVLRIRETERAARASIQSLLLLFLVSCLLRLDFPNTAFLIGFGLTPALLIIEKQLHSSVTWIMQGRGYGIDRVVVYSDEQTGTRIASSLLYSPQLGLSPVAVIGEDSIPACHRTIAPGYRRYHSVPAHAGPITTSLLKSVRCNLLIVALPHASSEKLAESIAVAREAGVEVTFLPTGEEEIPCAEWIYPDSLQPASTIGPIVPWHHALVKRAMDIAGSSLLIVLLFPFLAFIALLVRLSSGGPALFVQKRVGRNGEAFDMYKFRTMVPSAPRYNLSPTRSSDPRITGLGRFLRRTSLDELPQLLNVFLGNMSLVGPRPEMPFIVERYNAQQRRRLQLTPGITGLWQISADRAFPIHENIEYDLYYMKNRTFFMDLAILIHTLLYAAGGGV